MVNKRNKGNRIELEARKILESEGYLVEKKNYSRWQGNDFFNLFDILAIGPRTKLIQIKSNPSHFYKAKKDIERWMYNNPVKGVVCEIWLKESRKVWRREKLIACDSI